MNNIKVGSDWEIECFSPTGEKKWTENVSNLVVNSGLNAILNAAFRDGNTSQAFKRIGLKGSGAIAASNTIASHSPWSELTGYSSATRPLATFSNPAAGLSIDNLSDRAEFDITSNMTVAGMFLVTASNDANIDNKGGTTGALISVVDFAAPRAVIIGDILRVGVSYVIAGL